MSELDTQKLPRHIAIIMDGNGRWARKRRLSRIVGHRKGAEAVRQVVRTCRELGIETLTLYAFSVENWMRPKREIKALMGLLKNYLKSELLEMLENDIRLNVLGSIEDLPEDVKGVLLDTMERTKNNKSMMLNLALSYSGRSEIIRALRKVIKETKGGNIGNDEITEETFPMYLDTGGLHDPDLLIRTSGEWRISNFLLWQIAYSEIYFTDTLWPDFTREELLQALIDYQRRERRFGKTGDQIRRKR